MIGFDNSLRAELAANLAAHERRALPLEGRRHAGVAIVLVDSDRERHGGETLGLGQRRTHERHRGDWARDPGVLQVV